MAANRDTFEGPTALALPALIRRHRSGLPYLIAWAPYISLYQVSDRWPLRIPVELGLTGLDQILGRYTCPTTGTTQLTFEYEFTGYETEGLSNLDYAGARYYDPTLGSFLTHDPVRQFPSPYTYTNWDPVNRTDPTGEYVEALVVVAIVLAVAAGVATAVQGGLQGGPTGALKAQSLQLAGGSVPAGTSFGLNLLFPRWFGGFNARDYAIGLIPIAGPAYFGARDFGQGNYAGGVAGVLTAVAQAFAVAELANSGYGRSSAQGAVGGSPQAQASPSAASSLGSIARFGLQTAGTIWNLPNTVFGLIYGGLGYGVGSLLGTDPGVGFSYGQLQFTNNPFTSTAITFGNVGVYGTGPAYQPTALVPGTAFQNQFVEYQHTLQGRVLGPLYLPAHLVSGGIGTAYGFATGATDFVAAWHSGANLLEAGPHSTGPQPWW